MIQRELERIKEEKAEQADDLLSKVMFQNQKEVTADAEEESQPNEP